VGRLLLIPHSRARREEYLRQLRRAGLRQGPVELEEARGLAEPVDLALAQRRRRLADVVEGRRRLLLLAVAGDGHVGEAHGPEVRVEGLRAPARGTIGRRRSMEVATESCPATLNDQIFAISSLFSIGLRDFAS